MITKDRDLKPDVKLQEKIGAKVEQDVAFYLRRQFSDVDDVFIINDLRIQFNNETAQIDHLVIYNKGFIIIESKSIRGEVKINEQLEWSRTVRGKWMGMPSPIEQAKLQSQLLRALLNDNAHLLLAKIAFLQGYFGGRCWDQLCAASNDALIDRKSAPKDISMKLIKSESIGSAVKKLITRHRSGAIFNANLNFSREELNRIVNFLIEQHTPTAASYPKIIEPKTIEIEPAPHHLNTDTIEEAIKPNIQHGFCCKKCQNMETEPRYGKYGYYVYCPQCKTNTAMRISCYACHSTDAKVSKNKNTYNISCECGEHTQVQFK